jgi:uncharacterized membrane protein
MSISRKLGLPSIREHLTRRAPVRDVNSEHKEQVSSSERLAIFVADRVGTPTFFFLILLWTVIWLSWNFLAPAQLKFDKPMSFVFWLFISNCIQIFLMPLIMVAQNLQGRHAELRAENDYEVNVHASESVEIILQHIRYHTHQLAAIADKLGVLLPTSEAELLKAMEAPPVDKPSPAEQPKR